MTVHRRRLGALAVLTAAILALAGCGTPSPSPTATPAASTAASASGAPSTAPSVSPAPDVSAPFEAAFAAIKTGTMSLDGTVTVGVVQATLSGSETFSGPDSQDSTTMTLAGVQTTSQHVRVAGQRYAKVAAGPWLVDTSPESPSDLSKELQKAAGSVTDSGTEQLAGYATPLHKLVPTGATFDPAALGIGGGAATNVKATIVFYADDAGTPLAMTLELTWTQPSGSSTVDGSVSLQVGFSGLGQAHVIQAPDNVWTAFKSKRWGFRIAYPGDFDYTKGKYYEYFDGPTYQEIGAGRGSLPSGYTLNSIVKTLITIEKTSFHTKTVKNTAATVAGAKARLLTLTGTDKAKHKVIVYELVFVKGKYYYDLYWISDVGHEAADLAEFQQAVSSFTFS